MGNFGSGCGSVRCHFGVLKHFCQHFKLASEHFGRKDSEIKEAAIARCCGSLLQHEILLQILSQIPLEKDELLELCPVLAFVQFLHHRRNTSLIFLLEAWLSQLETMTCSCTVP